MKDQVRCPGCGRLTATQDDWDNIPEGEGEWLCWDGANCPASRERSAALDSLARELVELVEDDEPDQVRHEVWLDKRDALLQKAREVLG